MLNPTMQYYINSFIDRHIQFSSSYDVPRACPYLHFVKFSRVPERVRRGGCDGERAGAGLDLGDGAARLEADTLPGGRRDERRQGGGEQGVNSIAF